MQAIERAKGLGDKQAESIVLSNLGIAYWKMGYFFKAKQCFEQSLLLSQELGDRKTEVSVLNYLAATYEAVGDLVRATELYEHALLISKEIGI